MAWESSEDFTERSVLMNAKNFTIQKKKKKDGKSILGRRNSMHTGTEQIEAGGTLQRLLGLRKNEGKKNSKNIMVNNMTLRIQSRKNIMF